MNEKLHKGQRVRDKNLGWCTVIGFERFNSKGGAAPFAEVDDEAAESRVLVKMDDRDRWLIPVEACENPCLLRHGIVEVEALDS